MHPYWWCIKSPPSLNRQHILIVPFILGKQFGWRAPKLRKWLLQGRDWRYYSSCDYIGNSRRKAHRRAWQIFREKCQISRRLSKQQQNFEMKVSSTLNCCSLYSCKHTYVHTSGHIRSRAPTLGIYISWARGQLSPWPHEHQRQSRRRAFVEY